MHWNPALQDPPRLGASVVAIGIFDGLHLGHRALLSEARARAERSSTGLVVVTFDRDPDEVFRAEDPAFGKLLENAQRLEMLAEFTGGTVLSLPAVSEVFALEPVEFLDVLGAACSPTCVFVGADFRFGSHARGTVADIGAWGATHGCACEPRALVEDLGRIVTATRIRELLRAGEVSQARELLAGRPHAVHGRVVHGRGEGGGMGFATANLDLSGNRVMLPKEGVYGGYTLVGGQRYATAVNVGAAKSFAAATAPLEAHLIDFSGDLYGKEVTVQFVQWLRASRVFEDQDELIATVMGNIAWVRENLGDGACGAHR